MKWLTGGAQRHRVLVRQVDEGELKIKNYEEGK